MNMKENYKGLGHIAVYTQNLEASIAFYEKIGGELVARSFSQGVGVSKRLALVTFGGFLIELIQSPEAMPLHDGCIAHFAVYVDDIDKAAADIRAAGVTAFTTPEKIVMPLTFGGLQAWYFKGPSGETLELLQMMK